MKSVDKIPNQTKEEFLLEQRKREQKKEFITIVLSTFSIIISMIALIIKLVR